jgi:Jiraiya
MLKHMLTPASPGPRAQPVEVLGLSRPNHHPHSRVTHLSPQLNLSLQSHHSSRLNHSHLSTLSTSKHSLGGNSSSVSPGTAPLNHQHQTSLALVHAMTTPQLAPPPPPKMANGGLHLARRAPPPPMHMTRVVAAATKVEPGVREMMTSLGLLCLVSLLLALLALIFLLKISPATEVAPRAAELSVVTFEEYVVVYEVTLALCALTLSLNLCCLLVCAIQFLFAVKLARTPHGGER